MLFLCDTRYIEKQHRYFYVTAGDKIVSD